MIIRQRRSYLHEVSASAVIPGRIVPHQLRHTYASELLRCGVDFPALMKLLGHASPEMTMVYLDIALTDLAASVRVGPLSVPAYSAPAEDSAVAYACRICWPYRFSADGAARCRDVPAYPARRPPRRSLDRLVNRL